MLDFTVLVDDTILKAIFDMINYIIDYMDEIILVQYGFHRVTMLDALFAFTVVSVVFTAFGFNLEEVGKDRE